MTSKNDLIKQVLTRGVEEIINEDSLKKALVGRKKLRIKHGIDPTAPSLHIGHSVPLQKLRQFQDLGHTAVVVIGDYTAMIGDPSGQDKTRPPLGHAEVKKNSQLYKKQILKILKESKTEFHMQSEWFNSFKLTDVLDLLSRVSTAQLLSHDTFRQRLSKEQAFMAHELIYPLLQGYDSIALRADVEIGAMEQKFNLLMGRTLQKQKNMKPQDVLMVPYLIGTDGKEKMSKSLGNTVNLSDTPKDMYGKIMAIPDDLILSYTTLLTTLDEGEVVKNIKSNPRAIKATLASIVTATYWGEAKAKKAGEEFTRIFTKKELPTQIPVKKIPKKHINPRDLLIATGLANSKAEARRLIEQGGVYIDSVRITNWEDPINVASGAIVRVGKRKFIKIRT